jgi:hypothetical protein
MELQSAVRTVRANGGDNDGEMQQDEMFTIIYRVMLKAKHVANEN